MVEHCVSSAKGCGFNSQGTHILTEMQCRCGLKASAKCINVNVNRSNTQNRACHLGNMEISAKCDTYLCQPGNHVHALSPQWIKALAFWKHQLDCSLAISTSIYSQKSVIHPVLYLTYIWERERERERERARDAVYVWITTVTVKLWL